MGDATGALDAILGLHRGGRRCMIHIDIITPKKSGRPA